MLGLSPQDANPKQDTPYRRRQECVQNSTLRLAESSPGEGTNTSNAWAAAAFAPAPHSQRPTGASRQARPCRRDFEWRAADIPLNSHNGQATLSQRRESPDYLLDPTRLRHWGCGEGVTPSCLALRQSQSLSLKRRPLGNLKTPNPDARSLLPARRERCSPNRRRPDGGLPILANARSSGAPRISPQWNQMPTMGDDACQTRTRCFGWSSEGERQQPACRSSARCNSSLCFRRLQWRRFLFP